MNPTLRSKLTIGILLAIGTIVVLFPYYWLAVMATNTTGDIFTTPPKLTFGTHLIDNIKEVLNRIDFFGALLNTVIVSVGTTVLVLFFDSLAAFTFAKYAFPGRNLLFTILLATFVVPTQLSAIPQYSIMASIGWVGGLQALIVPAAANAFGIFWLRQYASQAIPDELLEAAKVDGAGFFRTYWTVAMPILRPALAFLGIFTFVGTWNDYLWPLIVMVDPTNTTLQVALNQLNGLYGADYSLVMAGTLMAVIPLLIVFLFGARHFIKNIAAGAVKG
ncbi:carbohydrate ABC transporter permease [Kibdelosporangium philippinense]|uniref:Carbohydrate ABC transporter permease n=1 Tax=Kibdelosporangium philippinense TaxID=211113 RepID=A0ABS8Z437_9PSEU|nr:carbohydrate ABC transporter permease [Kibdelosporangium philippinense]MCE7002689.1 carbohydrate ABC transporter permease [Kibdelosporangium philippinense]